MDKYFATTAVQRWIKSKTMADEYIRKADAIRWVKTECNPYGKPTLDFESGKKVIEHLERMPSADVVQVVRCKDCEYFDIRHWCNLNENDFNPDDFCSYGERREE